MRTHLFYEILLQHDYMLTGGVIGKNKTPLGTWEYSDNEKEVYQVNLINEETKEGKELRLLLFINNIHIEVIHSEAHIKAVTQHFYHWTKD